MLSFYKYPGDDVPVIKGSALCALEGHDDNIGKEKVLELMKTVDEYFPLVSKRKKERKKERKKASNFHSTLPSCLFCSHRLARS